MLYILIGKNPVQVEDTFTWAVWHGRMMKNSSLIIERDVYPAKKTIMKNKCTTRGQRKSSRRVLDKINAWRTERVLISTVFLGVDHGLLSNPILFETMIFGGQHDKFQMRYTTFDDARKNHIKLRKLIEH